MIDPRIPLQVQQPNYLNTIQNANQAAAFQNEAMQQNALRAFMRDNGAAVYAGDENALGQFARFDPQGALGIKAQHAQMRESEERLRIARAGAARAAADAKTREQAIRETQLARSGFERLGYALKTGDQGAWNMIAAEFGAPGLPMNADSYDFIGKTVDALDAGVRDALVGNVRGPEPVKPDYAVIDGQFYDKNNPQAGAQPLPGYVPEKKSPLVDFSGANFAGEPSAAPDEEELMKKLGGKEGELWASHLESGATSAGTIADMQLLDEIIELAPQGPVSGRIAAAVPGVNSAADAFQSVVKRVAPTLRAPGSGSTSDIEYDGMLKSLPQLAARPEANRAIAAMVKAKAQINIDRAAVVQAVQNRQMSIAEGRRRLSEIDQRSIMTPELKAIIGATGEGNGKSNYSTMDMNALISNVPTTEAEAVEWNRRWEELNK